MRITRLGAKAREVCGICGIDADTDAVRFTSPRRLFSRNYPAIVECRDCYEIGEHEARHDCRLCEDPDTRW